MTYHLPSADDLYRQALDAVVPRRNPSAWDWCSTHLRLRTGRWDPSRGKIAKHWYDIASARLTGRPKPGDPAAHLAETIALVTSAQWAKTTTGMGICAWAASEYPRDIGWYLTRSKDYRRFMVQKLHPMIELTEPLSRLLPTAPIARDQALGTETVVLGGASLTLLNANLSEDARSMALPLVVSDEFSRLAKNLAGEGDPLDLIRKRQRTFPHDRLMLLFTTPDLVTGHAWTVLNAGSCEVPLVQCLACGAHDYLDDHLVTTATGRKLEDYTPTAIKTERLARWACRHCGCLFTAAQLRQMVDECAEAQRWVAGSWMQTPDHPEGVWTPTADRDAYGRVTHYEPPRTAQRTGWANDLYSPFGDLDTFAAGKCGDYLKGTPEKKITWTNTEAARPFVYTVKPLSTDDILTSATYAHGEGPEAADLLILTVDQQENDASKYWFPYVVRAWKKGLGSWLIYAGKARNMQELKDLEERAYPVGGERRAPDLVVIDCANPNFRQHAYDWAGERIDRRLCLRGDSRLSPSETWREVPLPDPRKRQKTSRPAGVREWRIHPHYWRERLDGCLKMGLHGEMPWTLPDRASLPGEYLKSMTAEERILTSVRVPGGFETQHVWAKRVSPNADGSTSTRKDEHWADCEKMQLAVADILGLTIAPTPDPVAAAPVAARGDDYGASVW